MSDHGTVEIQAEYDDGSPVVARTRILRADPRVRIDMDLLRRLDAGETFGCAYRDDDVITLAHSYGQKFIYRLGAIADRAPDGSVRSVWMEWPD